VLDRLATQVVAAVLRLPAARTRRVTITRNLPVRVRDGVTLRAGHYAPDLPGAPTVLIRTPYGRGGPMRLLGRLAAERGFHVVIQSCRGTFGSGGTFAPLVHERDDGLDTVDWLRRQRWYAGAFGMFGASYQGFVQWAVAAEAGEELRAMVAVVTASATWPGSGSSSGGSPGWSPRWPTCRWPRRTGSPPERPSRSPGVAASPHPGRRRLPAVPGLR
jgi:predicted acyl esterase